MQPRTRIGLVVGAIGLALNICVSVFIGLCGPVATLLAGGVAGYFAASQEKPRSKNEGAKAGATAGGIAGALMIVGQVIGGVIALTIQQSTGSVPFIGTPGSDMNSQVIFYSSGIVSGICMGLVGAALAAAAGAGAGYLGTPEQPVMPPPPSQNIIS
jgi:hypothetical protein